MNKRTAATLSIIVLGSLALHAGRPAHGRALIDAPESATSPTAQDRPAEELSKNIQVLKGLPASRMLTVMHLMRTALGVRCDYCHIAEFGKYWMDDKPPKQVARRMITMVSELNKANFGGRPVVTCNTCHRGQTKPAAVPPILQGEVSPTSEEPRTKASDTLPIVDQVLEKYYRAIGGQAAAQKITSRVSKLSLLRGKLVNAGTPNVAMIPRGETWAVDLYQKAPNNYLAVMNSPNGTVYQVFNGTTGWLKTPDGRSREVSSGELARLARQADFLWPYRLKEKYSQMSVTGKEKIDDHEVFVIEATEASTSPPASGHQTTRLFFDLKTGLLLRRTILTETPFGLDPEQTDFQDYKEVSGVKMPFTVIVSYLDDKTYGTTRKYIEVKHNAPIDDAKFEKP